MLNRDKPDIELRIIFQDQLLSVVRLRLPIDGNHVSADPVEVTMRLVCTPKTLQELRDNKEVIDFIFPVMPQMALIPKGPAVSTASYNSEGRVIE
jgi:hypothetical protein